MPKYKNIILKPTACAAASLMVAASPHLFTAQAGIHSPRPVQVNLRENVASGDVYSARHDASPEVFIVCETHTPPTEGDPSDGTFSDGTVPRTRGVAVACSAQDASQNYARCVSDNRNFAIPVHGITEFSFIQFEFQPSSDPKQADDECTLIEVLTSSELLP